MDDHTDDRDSGPPPVGTPEELEEALRWLEELTARQGKPAEPSSLASSASLDSPFRGLIDSEDGDLPDWLREVPSSPDQEGLEETEMESRLDWLAKMAQRESIEELPTLEWRRLSDPSQSAIMAVHSEVDLPQPGETDEEEQDEVIISGPVDETAINDVLVDDGDFGVADDNAGGGEAADDWAGELAPITEFIDAELKGDETLADDLILMDIDETDDPITVESYPLDKSFLSEETAAADEPFDPDAPAGYETYDSDLPPLDDLDAAMAWIEELAVSQETPLEDLPSVADRALASQLMAEAGLSLSTSSLDEIGSDSDLLGGATPPHPFIEEEDFADTVVLVETLAAEQSAGHGADDEMPTPTIGIERDESSTADIPEPIVLGEITPFAGSAEARPNGESADESAAEDSADELSFDEAMALLDEMVAPGGFDGADGAIVEIVETTTAIVEVEAEIEPGPTSEAEGHEQDEGIGDKTDSAGPMDIAAERVPEYFNGRGHSPLEEALQSLDALALPPGKSMDEIDASLRTSQAASWRDVNSALEWLESTLAVQAVAAPKPVTEMDEEALIAQMPEDPDAVLAWLEQMSGEEEPPSAVELGAHHASGVIADAGQPEPLIEDLATADLLNMPEDPDEAMAWLEGLAREAVPIEEAPTSIEEAPTMAYFREEAEAEIDQASRADDVVPSIAAGVTEEPIFEVEPDEADDEDTPIIEIGAAEAEWETAEEAQDEATTTEAPTPEEEATETVEAEVVTVDADDADVDAVVDIAVAEAEMALADDVDDVEDEAAEWAEETYSEVSAGNVPQVESETLVVTIDTEDSDAGENVIDLAIAEAELAQAEDAVTDAAEWLEGQAQPEEPLVVEVEPEDVPEEEPAEPQEEDDLSWLDLLKPLD